MKANKIYFFIHHTRKLTGSVFVFDTRTLQEQISSLINTEIVWLDRIEKAIEMNSGFIVIIPYNHTEYIRGRYDYYRSVKGEIVSYFDTFETPYIELSNVVNATSKVKYLIDSNIIKEYKIENLTSYPRIIFIPFTLSDPTITNITIYDRSTKRLKKEFVYNTIINKAEILQKLI